MKNNKVWKDIQKAFNTGVSYMLPSVVVGGILLAVALATGTATDTGMEVTNPFMKNLNDLGSAGFAMMIPILSGYIAYSLAGKPGIAPGMILGYVANNPIGESEVKTGFLGAMILGLATGYLVRWCKTWKVSNTIKTIMPILIVPIFTTFILGIIYIYVISVPIGACMDWLVKFLSGMQGGNAVLLGHPFAKFFLRHAQHFHIFEHIVAKIMKELAFDGLQFCCRLFRKRVLQVGTYHLPPVTDHMIQPEIDKIGQRIQYRKRKNSQKPHSYIGQQIEEFRFHVYCVIVPFSAVPSSLKSPKRTFTTLLSNAASLSTSTRI